MREPKTPENEAERLETLRRLNILDTPRHDRFDRYTRISTRIFNVPMAMISLVDADRQWFKSTAGFDAEETPRDVSFCGHAILGDDVFEVRNARRDPRFRNNPLVVEQPHVSFYAGAPLEAPNGHKLGTLCLIDRVPRRLDDEEKRMLKNLADMVVAEMINYVDTDTGLEKRNSLLLAGAKCFAAAREKNAFSLLLFDLTEVTEAGNGRDQQAAQDKAFANLLRRHFPQAESVAALGREDFCVLVRNDDDADQAWAIDAVCTAAREQIFPGPQFADFNALVGRIDYDPEKYASFIDMLYQADELFFIRDTHPSPEIAKKAMTREALARWRKTIF